MPTNTYSVYFKCKKQVLHLFLFHLVNYWLFLYRTQQDRNATEPSPLPTTAEPWASSSCTTSPTRSLSLQCKTGELTKNIEHSASTITDENVFNKHLIMCKWSPTGPHRLRHTHGITLRSFQWVTSVTWRMRGWWPLIGADSYPSISVSHFRRMAQLLFQKFFQGKMYLLKYIIFFGTQVFLIIIFFNQIYLYSTFPICRQFFISINSITLDLESIINVVYDVCHFDLCMFYTLFSA